MEDKKYSDEDLESMDDFEEGITDESAGEPYGSVSETKIEIQKYKCRKHGETENYIILGKDTEIERCYCLECIEDFLRKTGGVIPMEKI